MKKFARTLAITCKTSIVLCIALITKAQETTKFPMPVIIPPNTASLFKTLERPLGTYTGTIPISFPLMSITSGILSADVTLNYNSTGGIKVEEYAGSVGLGFSLGDGAGMITQIVRDKEDDFGRLKNSVKPSNFDCENMTQVETLSRNQLDLEPDIFMYNINGRSGKFYLKDDGTVFTEENSGLKITYFFEASGPNPRINRWIIIDEAGNTYYFGQNKALSVNYRLINNTTYSSTTSSSTSSTTSSKSWYLTEVYDMNFQNSIKYSWVNSTNGTTTFSGGGIPLNPAGSSDVCRYFNTNNEQGSIISGASEYLISRIDGNSGSIVFNSTADRMDGISHRVRNIQLIDSLGAIKKQIRFNHSYFSPTSPSQRRLRLDSFSEFGESISDSLTNRFSYNETSLPAPMSLNVDFWGFSNGASNSSVWPNIVFYNGSFIYRKYDFANKNANPIYGAGCILKKITYPTGGYREFFYEGNTVLTNQYLNVYYHPDPDYTAEKGFSRSDFKNIISPVACMVHNFSINSVDVGADFTYYLTGIGGVCSGYSVKLFKVNVAGSTTGGLQMYNLVNQPGNKWSLPNGHYRIEVYKNSPGCTFATLDGFWKECTLNVSTITTPNGTYSKNNRKAGGVRIREIQDYDPVSTKINKTEYKYKLYSTDSLYTSGLLVVPVTFVGQDNDGTVFCNYFKLLSSTNYPLSQQGGSYVVYPEVRTIENGNGWTDRKYSYEADIPSSAFPITPVYNNSAFRGQLLSEKIFKQDGTPVKSTTSLYTYGTQVVQLGYKVKPYWLYPKDGLVYWTEFRPAPPENDIPDHAACQRYSVHGQATLLSQTTDSIFSAGVSQVIVKKYIYYSNNGYYLLNKETTSINSSKTREINYRYSFDAPTDFSFGLNTAELSMKDTLLSKNYLQALEVSNKITSSGGSPVLLGGSKYVFGYFNGNKIHLANMKTYTSPTSFTEIFIKAYDNKGNLLEKYQPGNAHEVYLWGYKGSYPVAKITGSDYATVSSWITPSILNNPLNDSVLQSHLNVLRNNLSASHAQVVTYSYKPLVGITSSTDAKGMTTYYEYDNFQRLKLIKDRDGNIIKTYQYNYKR